MQVKPFSCIRPAAHLADQVAALPYDVYSRAEAAQAAAGHPLSFLNIDRPETQFPPEQDMYAPEVYERAHEMLDRAIDDETYIEDVASTFYIYRLEANGRCQTGLVALCAVDDYLDGTVKKHENTRPEKEQDRIRHIEALNAQTGPIFLTYRPNADLAAIVASAVDKNPLYRFTCDDGVTHTVWRVDSARRVAGIAEAFGRVPCAYIADGHHRAASAVRVAQRRRQEHPDYTGDEEFNYFMSVLFPADELAILPYNRVVRDLGASADGTPRDHQDFMSDLCRAGFAVTTADEGFVPERKGLFGMYLGGSWWMLHAPESTGTEATDPVASLDASVLQDKLLEPVLGIHDPRSDPRIDFVGGIRGTAELERLVNEQGWAVAFSMHPTAMDELLAVADAGRLMPPKSTWFEPKLRSGLFIHRI